MKIKDYGVMLALSYEEPPLSYEMIRYKNETTLTTILERNRIRRITYITIYDCDTLIEKSADFSLITKGHPCLDAVELLLKAFFKGDLPWIDTCCIERWLATPCLDEAVFSYGIEDKPVRIKILVASSPSAPESILASLANDHLSVREEVAKNPNSSTKLLKKLSRHRDWYTQFSVAKHHNTSMETLIALSLRGKDKVVRCKAQESLARIKNEAK